MTVISCDDFQMVSKRYSFFKNKTDLYMQSYYLYNEKVKVSNI